MSLTREEVEHVALLARLGLSEAELEKFRRQLSTILENFQILNQLDTSAVSPTAQVIFSQNVVRPDKVLPSFAREEIVANAPRQEEGLFRVKAVLE